MYISCIFILSPFSKFNNIKGYIQQINAEQSPQEGKELYSARPYSGGQT
tara:strand:+ start:149 stop:295 length:147 start_codon:yes stop_codon:yes gene_type:complete